MKILNPKVVALAIVAVILISGTFYYLKVDYPFGIEIKPPVTKASIFAKTIVPTDGLGFGTANATKLTLGSKTLFKHFGTFKPVVGTSATFVISRFLMCG